VSKNKPRLPKQLLYVLGAAIVFVAVVAAVWLFSDNRKPLTWEESFNKQNATGALIDMSNDHPRHWISFDFDPESENEVKKFTVVVCWGASDSPEMQEDHVGWAIFTDQVRRYGTSTKMDVIDTGETSNGKSLKAMRLTGEFDQARTIEDAQESARRVSAQLREYSPCKMN
jgi:hypothetical protein